MNADLKDIKAKLAPLVTSLKRYTVLLFIVFVSILFAVLVLRIDTLAKMEPDDTVILEQLKTVQRPKIDETAVEKIQQLQDQNIEIESLFKQARDNPFSE